MIGKIIAIAIYLGIATLFAYRASEYYHKPLMDYLPMFIIVPICLLILTTKGILRRK